MIMTQAQILAGIEPIDQIHFTSENRTSCIQSNIISGSNADLGIQLTLTTDREDPESANQLFFRCMLWQDYTCPMEYYPSILI